MYIITEIISRLAMIICIMVMNIFRSVENVNLSTVIAYKKDGVTHHFLDTYEKGYNGEIHYATAGIGFIFKNLSD